jgi:superfamily I DNA/RNA helicase
MVGTRARGSIPCLENSLVARLSKYQKAFCEAVQTLANGGLVEGKRHIILDAKAGSGKTQSIVWAMRYIPTSQRVVALMFNKRNAEDIQPKLPQTGNIEARTTHSLGGRVLRRNGAGRLDDNKMRGILNEMELTFPERQLLPQARKLISIAKAMGIVPSGYRGAWGLLPDEQEIWSDLIDHYSIDFDEPWQEETAISIARDALRISIDRSGRNGTIDFDDMLFLPVVMRMQFPKYDWVFGDEGQDFSSIQHEIVKRSLSANGHAVIVGDPNQSCYGFRAAALDSMSTLQKDLDAHVMPLSICYRCDKEIVLEAKRIVPAIEYHDIREEGSVAHGLGPGTKEEKLAMFTPDSVILCPRNAPLVETAFGFIRKRIACHMVGRDFAQGLVKLLQKLGAQTAGEAEKNLDLYFQSEWIRLEGKEEKLQSLEDRCSTLRVFLSESPSNETVDRIISAIEALFDENAQGMLTLSSIHRGKGGQWPRVFLLGSEMLGASTIGTRDRVRQLLPWEIQQRRNLLYIAVTRAEHELFYVTTDDMEDLFR